MMMRRHWAGFGLKTPLRASRGSFVRVACAVLAALCALSALPAGALAWWNDEWSERKKISIDTSATGANVTEAIGSMPVLVRLHIGNFRFGNAKEDGSDLRFVASDDKTPLKYHVEKFDALLGEALIWVGVPNLNPGTKSDIWLYYGNKKAPAASDPKGTFDPDTLGVYHFGERGTPAQDSSAWANHAQSVGRPADSAIIGTGLRLDGNTPLTLPASLSQALAENGALTWSVWIKPASLQRNAAIISRRDGANAIVVGLDDGAPFVEVTANGSVQRSAPGAPVAPGGWHHVAMAATPGLITLYLDGNPYASLNANLPAISAPQIVGGGAQGSSAAVSAPAPQVQPSPAAAATADAGAPAQSAEAGLPANGSTPAPSGAAPAAGASAAPPAPVAAVAEPAPSAQPLVGFVGDVDELQISKAARPAGFVAASAIGQGADHAKLVSFSVDEEAASWLTGYFATILRSVTLDGWVVISLLVLLGLSSWMVMVEKNSFLGRQRKANAEFASRFQSVGDDLTSLDLGDADVKQRKSGGRPSKLDAIVIRNSSLYRIYRVGVEQIRLRSGGRVTAGPVHLRAEAIAAVRASLDARLVREVQLLNRSMVLLTIAISGGPFLGLLGTVIGVMITFAAIAASGDVNVNAIAPGVAGALMATVTGLAVAIPALFGYNYLLTRIKDLTSDMQVFVDEFTTRMAEVHAVDRPDPIAHHLAAE